MSLAVRPRREVPVEHTWDAYSVYPNDAAWEEAFQAILSDLNGLTRYHGQLADSPELLSEWLNTYCDLFSRTLRVYIYASMFNEVDTADQAATAMASRANGLFAQYSAAVAFADPELLAIDAAKLEAWTADGAPLALYRHYFAELAKRRAHVRSAEVEELLGLINQPFNTATNVHSVMSDADLKFGFAKGGPEGEVTHGTIGSLLSDPDRDVRQKAWTNYADEYLAHRHSIAACIETGVQQHAVVAKARKYDSCLQAALEPNHIPLEVFHNLIDTYKRRIPIWHKYWEVRRKALGYDKLHVWDIKAPLATNPPKVSYEQSVEWCCEGMKPLGEEYVSIMRRGCLEDRWVDIYPNQNKRMGAFSSGAQGLHPFILMNYDDDLFSLSTLAHELGHSMHSYHSWRDQPPIYAEYSIFVAEVASNFNQALVRDYLFKTQPDRDFQITMIEEAMANYHRYFFIMPTLARFELEIHERVERGEALPADDQIALMASLFKEGYGDQVEFDHDRIGITWAEFPTHLYSNFYVYQYATGISGALALANGVLAEGNPAADRYLGFLSAGSSKYPLDALKDAGVDLSQPEPVEAAFDDLESLVERLDKLVN
jgi:oligoendopeptidase F